MAKRSVLCIDDDPDVVKSIAMLLGRHDIGVTGAQNPALAWASLAHGSYDICLLDLNFARGHSSCEEGFAFLARLLALDPGATVIVMTGHGGINIAVQAMQAGACDFLVKPWNNDRLVATVNRAFLLRDHGQEHGTQPPPPRDRIVIGEAPALVQARTLAARLAPSDAAATLLGAPGTGKSLFARHIHGASRRALAGLAVLPCAALDSADMLDALVADAAPGTLVLDDIDRMPPVHQARLAASHSKARLLATSRLEPGALRAKVLPDLLNIIGTFEIILPPLADRKGDAALLADYFLDFFAARHRRPKKKLDDDAAQLLAVEDWPENVRQLRHACERAVLLGTGESYRAADFQLAPSMPPREVAADAAPRTAPDLNLARRERVMVEAALKRHGFNVSRAAADLGLSRAAMYRRMAKHDL